MRNSAGSSLFSDFSDRWLRGMKTLGTRLNDCVYDKRYQQKLLTRYLKHHVNHCTFNVLTVDVYSSLYKFPDDLLKLHNIGFFLHDISPFHEIPHNSQQGRSTHNILIIEIAATPREQTRGISSPWNAV